MKDILKKASCMSVDTFLDSVSTICVIGIIGAAIAVYWAYIAPKEVED